ncbi:aspartate dehydrogenase [Bradyrhizobium sp. USDA 4472]
MTAERRLALIGYGAMARATMAGLTQRQPSLPAIAVLVRSSQYALQRGIAAFQTVDDLIAWKPDLVAECASQLAVATNVPALLAAGIDVIIASIGALADRDVLQRIEAAAASGRARFHLVSGGVGGLDCLSAAKLAGLDAVTYVGRKPPRAWRETPAQAAFDLEAIAEPTVIFEGTAQEACRLFPKNANVTAAIALAGIGFERTTVRLVADPDTILNRHEIRAHGRAGEIEVRLSNEALPDNPKTSWLASLSVEQVVRRELLLSR